MSDFSLVPREYPESNIKFSWIDNPSFGMINLCCWEEDLLKVWNKDELILDDEKIYILFPLYENFFVKEYYCQNGFTLEYLIELIVKTGLEAGEYDTSTNPGNYNGPANKYDFINRFAITSSNTDSDIKVSGNKIFVSVQS